MLGVVRGKVIFIEMVLVIFKKMTDRGRKDDDLYRLIPLKDDGLLRETPLKMMRD